MLIEPPEYVVEKPSGLVATRECGLWRSAGREIPGSWISNLEIKSNAKCLRIQAPDFWNSTQVTPDCVVMDTLQPSQGIAGPFT
jgi:hypothetical protein